MENNQLKILFQEVCQSQDCITDEQRMNAAIEKVYTTLLTKVLHCRFAPIIRRWAEINVKSNDKQVFRAGLKAATARVDSHSCLSSGQRIAHRGSKSSPDMWSKMNVSAALRIFEVQTLAEVAGSTYGDLEGDSARG